MARRRHTDRGLADCGSSELGRVDEFPYEERSRISAWHAAPIGVRTCADSNEKTLANLSFHDISPLLRFVVSPSGFRSSKTNVFGVYSMNRLSLAVFLAMMLTGPASAMSLSKGCPKLYQTFHTGKKGPRAFVVAEGGSWCAIYYRRDMAFAISDGMRLCKANRKKSCEPMESAPR